MKNAKNFLLLICALSFTFLIGFFIGRNQKSEYVSIKINDTVVSESVSSTEQDFRLDINSATEKQLIELPGIGDVIAKRIIEYRSVNGAFTTIDELIAIEGIGNAKLQRIESLIRVGG